MAGKTLYGVSPWLDASSPRRRPSWPRHRGHLDVDVAIVGGGLTGCLAAYAFAAAGVKVALFEADRVAAGATAMASGLFGADPAAPVVDLEKEYGRRAARHAYEATRRAALDFATAIRRLDIRCGIDQRRALLVASERADPKLLAREAKARREAGLDTVWLPARRVLAEAAIASSGAIAVAGDAHVDALSAGLGFAKAATERGARIFERTSVGRIKPRRKGVDIRLDGGSARAAAVVIATGWPPDDVHGLRRHFRRQTTYMVVTEPLAAGVRRELGARTAIVRDTEGHFLHFLRDDRVLFGGADQPPVASQSRDRTLVQRTGQLMYELSLLYPAISGALPEYGWDAGYVGTRDGLPFIGRHRNFPRHLFALGFGRNGLAHAYLASRILVRDFLEQPAKGDEVFGFVRIAREPR